MLLKIKHHVWIVIFIRLAFYLLPSWLFLALPYAVSAQFICTTNNNQISIEKYIGSEKYLIIPTIINGHPVTRIGYSPFSESAGLTTIKIPSEVILIEHSAFSDCRDITDINVDLGNLVYSSINGVLFNKNRNRLIRCPEGRSGSYTIPNGVEIIEQSAFQYCIGLIDLIIPDSVRRISSSAFFHCEGLNYLKIPKGVENVGYSFDFPDFGSPFAGCVRLEYIDVNIANRNYKSVEGILFDKAERLLISYPPAKLGDYQIPKDTWIQVEAFINCWGLSKVIIPDTVREISVGAFQGCTNLLSVEIPNSVTTIRWNAFRGCSGLTNVIISLNTKILDFGTFDGCVGLKSVKIPFGISQILGYAFNGCVGLTNILIPESVSLIDSNAFSNCHSLISVTIPSSVRYLGLISAGGLQYFRGHIFGNCRSLKSIDVDGGNPNYKSIDGVLFNKIGDTLIHYPTGKIGDYVVPEGVANVGQYAFINCRSLTKVILPPSIINIAEGAFYGCSSLVYARFLGSVPTIGRRLFFGAENTIVYFDPNTAGWTSIIAERPAYTWSQTQPKIISINGLENNQIRLEINVPVGSVAIVEATTNILQGRWELLFNNVADNGRIFYSDQQQEGLLTRFYRVRTW